MMHVTVATRAIQLLLVTAVFLALASPGARAQISTTGTVNGTVTDSKGGAVPQAAITVINEGTKEETHTLSNGDGSYVVAGLTPGRYTVTVVKDQFKAFTTTDVILNTAQVMTVNAELSVGSTTTTVTVEASAAQVQTSTPEVSNQVNQQQISTLPLNGRNYQSLSFLMPGVTNLNPDTAQNQGGFSTFNSISVNGLGEQGTQYYVDGIWNENTGDFSQTTVTPNPDTIQEVRLLQNNYGAEYTLNGASVLLLETKSGTDSFHGSAYDYLRNDAFDARNAFSPSVSPLKQNIFGYTVGGPVPHPGANKTYFFWSEQWVKQHIGNIERGATATMDQRNGTFTTPINDPTTGMPFPQTSPGVYQIPSGEISQGALALLNAIAPLPNNPGGGFLNYINVQPEINSQRDDEIKIDQNIGTRLRLTAEYLDERQNANFPYQTLISDPFPATHQTNETTGQLARVQLTQTLSQYMVNSTSVSMNNYVLNLVPSGVVYQSQVPGFNEVLPFPIPSRGGGPPDRIPMIIFAGGYPIIGLTYIFPVSHGADLEDSFSDDWSWLHGKHYFKAGIQYVRGTKRQTAFSATGGEWVFTGRFTGNPMADYLLGDATELMQTNNEFRGHQTYPIVSPYVQDQWKLTRRLTLTLGLRYAYSPNTAWQGPDAALYSNFIPSQYNASEAPIVNNNGTITATPNYNPNNGIALLGTPGAPRNYSNGHNSYWNPTVGFAYDVFGDGKTSLRGGYGVSHEQTLSLGCQPPCLNNPPNISTSTLLLPKFPDSTGGIPTSPTVLTLEGEATNFREPLFQTYSLGIEHQFGQWFASVTGAGARVSKQSALLNINQPTPEGGFDFDPILNTGSVSNYATSVNGPAPYQGYGALNIYENLGYTNWNALELNVRHPVGHDLFFSAAYTWQHGLTTARGANGLLSGSGFQNVYDPRGDYGTSNTNVGQALTMSAIWNIPIFRNSEGWKKALLGGWSYSDITTIQSGFSLDPGLSTGNPGLAKRPDRVPGTSISGPKSVAEWFNTAAFAAPAAGFFGDAGPGSITGPGVVNFDMALYKDFKIRERYAFEFRSEFFNIFNHTNLSGVSTNFGAGNYGQVTSALDPRIMELALRFQF